MSWYVGKDGAHLWIKRDETVFTVIQPADSLPVESLTYLALNSRKAAYQEHLINDDAGDVKNNSKRRRDKQAGRQRGYVVRIEQEEQLRVVPWFKAAALKLIDDQVVSRVDADEAANSKSKKKNNKPANVSNVSLGVNECRVETSSRIHHFAHGPGFSVEVCEGSVHQKIHFFTNRKELSGSEWHSHLVAAVESMGAHVMLARRTNEEATQEDLQSKAAAGLIERVRLLAKDNAQKEDDAWLDSVMNAKAEESSSEEESSADEESPKKPEPAVTNGKGAEANAPTRRTTEAAKAAGETLEWRRREPTTSAKQQPRQSQQSSKQQSKQQQSKQEQPAKWQPSSIQQLLRQQMLQQQPSGVPPPRQHEPPSRQQQPPLQQQPTTRVHQQPIRQQPQQHQQHIQHQEYNQSQRPPRHRETSSLQQPHSWEQQWWQRGEDEQQDWQQQQHWWHASDHRHEEEQRWQPPARQEEQQRRQPSARHEEEHRWQPSVSQEEQQQRWQPSARLAPERPAPQRQEQPIYHASAAQGSIVDQLFARARTEERPPAPVQPERSDQATACGECGRGRPLKLFMDPDDSQWYCRMCWVDFYGKEPPGK